MVNPIIIAPITSKYTELSCGAQEECNGVGEQGTKVGQCANAHKDNNRIEFMVNAEFYKI